MANQTGFKASEVEKLLAEKPAVEEPVAAAEAEVAVEAPRTRRHDPRPRPGSLDDITRLQNADPSRKYVLCYRAHVDRYLDIGWEIERHSDTGVRLSGRTVKDGEPLEMAGHVLMSMDKRDHADLEKYGYKDGGAVNGLGQVHADKVQKEIISRDTHRNDALRGILRGTEYFRLHNETTPETVEVRG